MSSQAVLTTVPGLGLATLPNSRQQHEHAVTLLPVEGRFTERYEPFQLILDSGSAMLESAFTSLSAWGAAHQQPNSTSAPLLLASLTCRHTADLAAIQFRQEEKTGLSFPEQICRRDDVDCLDLKGVGVRSKRILVKDLKVYAVGFYVDSQAVLDRLGPKYRGIAQDGIRESSFLASALVADEGIAKAIRLVMCRSVSPTMIGGSLYKKVSAQMDSSRASLSALAKFSNYFKPGDAELSKGTSVTFTWSRDGTLTTSIGQREVGTIANAQLAKALFSIYLGNKPVCVEAKEDLKEELSRLISSRQ